MCCRGWKSFLGIFGVSMTLEPFSLSSPQYIGCLHHQPKGGARLHVKRGPNRAFMTEIDNIKEASLGSEPLGGGLEAAATR
jgi:hypothetical protein